MIIYNETRSKQIESDLEKKKLTEDAKKNNLEKIKKLTQNIEEKCINDLVKNSFREFFSRHITTYENYKKLPINFVGSIAHHFKTQLQEVAQEFESRIGIIIKAPVGKLIEYHSNLD